MTTLSARPVEDPDQLALIADDWTATARPFAEAFRDACLAEAVGNDRWVDPNRVRRRLIAEFGATGYDPRQLSALWSASCGRSGFLDKTDVEVPIVGEGSRGNANKNVRLRRWRT